MTPTPPSHSSFQTHFNLRRPRTANFHQQQSHSPQTPVTPLPDLEHDGGVNNHRNGRRDSSNQDEDTEYHEHRMEDDDHGIEDEVEEEELDEEGGIEEVPMEIDAQFDPEALGLKEIGNLASWTVSTFKPGCGVEALRDDDMGLFWQSDGPQPHHLNIHFSRLVSILSIRIYLDFEADESYTPTRITLLAGTGYHDLIPFASLDFAQPKGWIDVPLDDVGGGEDGKTLRAFLVQVKVVENHQNGKDTHVRGLKIYAKDDRIKGGLSEREVLEAVGKKKTKILAGREAIGTGEGGWLVEEDWMGEPELR